MTNTLSWKVRLAVLWVCGPVLEVAHLVIFSRVDDWGKYKGDFVLLSTVLLLIPLIMCLLSLLLRDRLNKWVNIIAGIFYAGPVYILEWLEGGLGVIMYEGPPLGTEHALILGLKVIITVFIPWLAFKWPKQTA